MIKKKYLKILIKILCFHYFIHLNTKLVILNSKLFMPLRVNSNFQKVFIHIYLYIFYTKTKKKFYFSMKKEMKIFCLKYSTL